MKKRLTLSRFWLNIRLWISALPEKKEENVEHFGFHRLFVLEEASATVAAPLIRARRCPPVLVGVWRHPLAEARNGSRSHVHEILKW